MKTLVTILIGVSLTFTAAMAQQDEGTPGPKKRKQERQQRQEERQQQRTARQQEHGMRQANRPDTTRGGQSGQKMHQEMQNRLEHAAAGQGSNVNANPKTGQVAARSERRTAKTRPDTQTVQRIRQQHTNFHAQARPEKVPSVTYQENYRIANADQWRGSHYAAFRAYHPVRHDRGWWNSHYNHIVLIGGGYYYWNDGYWYPAWGYDPAASYYTYNGPIYTGRVAEPPDQVIANVQAALQDLGYYKGDVDGLLGPLTREALSEYQRNNGLYVTEAIDQPTLDSLGLT
jgi:peptidoglycan hydrolase-like protein with peptidoglycan-binding domain